MKIDICGIEYTIFYESDDSRFEEIDCNGYCECYAKEIHVKKIDRNDKMNFKNIENFEFKVLTHEIIHAILFECGQTEYFDDEKLVDTIAMLLPKIIKCVSNSKKALKDG